MDIRIFTGGDLDIQTCFLILHSSDSIEDNFKRRCYGNFFCCDDQKRFRGDSKTHEHVDVPLKTNYLGDSMMVVVVVMVIVTVTTFLSSSRQGDSG